MMTNDQQKHLDFFLAEFIAVMTGACSLKLQKFEIETPAQILSTVGGNGTKKNSYCDSFLALILSVHRLMSLTTDSDCICCLATHNDTGLNLMTKRLQ